MFNVLQRACSSMAFIVVLVVAAQISDASGLQVEGYRVSEIPVSSVRSGDSEYVGALQALADGTVAIAMTDPEDHHSGIPGIRGRRQCDRQHDCRQERKRTERRAVRTRAGAVAPPGPRDPSSPDAFAVTGLATLDIGGWGALAARADGWAGELIPNVSSLAATRARDRSLRSTEHHFGCGPRPRWNSRWVLCFELSKMPRCESITRPTIPKRASASRDAGGCRDRDRPGPVDAASQLPPGNRDHIFSYAPRVLNCADDEGRADLGTGKSTAE